MEIYKKIKDSTTKEVQEDPLKEKGGWLNVEDQGYKTLKEFIPKLGNLGRVKKAIDNLNKDLYCIEIFSRNECLLLEFYDLYEDCLDSLIKYSN